jgi:two-component system sensor histidine kinase YesM
VSHNFSPTVFVFLGFTIISVLLVILVIHLLSNFLLSRIFTLTGQMHEVRKGNWNIIVDTSGQDEIGELALSIDAMLKQINTLFNKTYAAEIREKDMQIQLLQAKIKPHFLYNSLSTINWIALENGQQKICDITNALSSFYRTALNQGKEKSSLETELANAKAYMYLQQIAHDETLCFSVDVEEGLEKTEVPGFILQPLLENAIEHGIDHRTDGKGIIQLRVFKKDGVLHLEVRDNGSAPCNCAGISIFSKSGYGYGLNNIDHRIRLIYGDAYGVSLSLGPGGACAEITLPG